MTSEVRHAYVRLSTIRQARFSIGLLGMVMIAGCGVRQQLGATIQASDSTTAELFALTNAFWLAAGTSDSQQMGALSVGGQPLRWASRQTAAYPLFFDSTSGRLAVHLAFHNGASRDSAIIQVRAPWRTCRPPAHSGSTDIYSIGARRISGTWRIVRVWFDPC